MCENEGRAQSKLIYLRNFQIKSFNSFIKKQIKGFNISNYFLIPAPRLQHKRNETKKRTETKTSFS